MNQNFEGTTLALQHYYDIVATSRRLPLLTVYQAMEQPFGRTMAVWMATPLDGLPCPPYIKSRLDRTLLLNRAVNAPHVLRILDFGTGEGQSFVVTDPVQGLPLRDIVHERGRLEAWQVLRLLEQLTGIVHAAHLADLRFLCLSADNIFVTDPARFEIIVGPMGMGLHRSEIMSIPGVCITTNRMRHIPPWEFAREHTVLPMHREDTAVNLAETDIRDEDSIQDLDLEAHPHTSDMQVSLLELPPEGLCPDVYGVAAILYEAICGAHPYFGDNREICDAVLTILQERPKHIAERCELPPSWCDALMEVLQSPKEGALERLLNLFAATAPPGVIDQARRAEKTYLTPDVSKPKTRPKKTRRTIAYPRLLKAAILTLAVALSVFITYAIAGQKRPTDLFALPEILPATHHGVDLVIASQRGTQNASVYLTSFADGSLIRLGNLPLQYRNQMPGARLQFVIADDKGNTKQLPILVQQTPGLQLVQVDLNW